MFVKVMLSADVVFCLSPLEAFKNVIWAISADLFTKCWDLLFFRGGLLNYPAKKIKTEIKDINHFKCDSTLPRVWRHWNASLILNDSGN